MLFLLLIYIFLRGEWLTTAVLFVVTYTLLALAFTTSRPARLTYIVQAAAVVITVSRFGLLSTIVYFLFFSLDFDYPLTTDLSSWYAGNGLFAIGMMLLMSGYGFYTSLGSQKLFHAKLLEE